MEKLAILGGPKKIKIPFPHFNWPQITEGEIRAVQNYMRNGKMGKNGYPEIVEEFEERFRKYHRARFALAMNSGTSCLHAAYYALGVGPGDEVIVPNFTFPATATPLFVLGAIPILCDCLRDTVTIDPDEIERRISRKTKVIAITHLWGHPCEMDKIMKISRKCKIPVLEDCSHAHGAKYKGKLVGTFGAVSCFSCDNKKMIPAGEAGIIITNSKEIFEKCLIFTDFGPRVQAQITLPELKKYNTTGLGLKYRIHPLAAVIANEKFKKLDRMNRDRVTTLGYFSDCLRKTKSIIPPVIRSYVEIGGVFGYKPVYDSQKLHGLDIKDFIRILQAEGVDVRQTVTPPLHRTELFSNSCNYGVSTNTKFTRKIRYNLKDFPSSEWFFNNHLSFATFSRYSDREIIDQYIEAIHKVENMIINNPDLINQI